MDSQPASPTTVDTGSRPQSTDENITVEAAPVQQSQPEPELEITQGIKATLQARQ